MVLVEVGQLVIHEDIALEVALERESHSASARPVAVLDLVGTSHVVNFPIRELVAVGVIDDMLRYLKESPHCTTQLPVLALNDSRCVKNAAAEFRRE